VLLGGTSAWAERNPMRFVHNGPESANDSRYDYHWRVLKAALDATEADWGPYTMQPAHYMNEPRQTFELARHGGLINTMVLDTTRELERRFIPVRIPIDKGLLGYRVFLIRKSDQEKFAGVRSLADLRRFTMGQGADWSDVKIYQDAGFRVVTGSSYEGLFGMLNAGRFDAFGRGVSEVLGEVRDIGATYPDLAIEENVLLYYPMPVYFWLPATPEGRQRARRIEAGMRLLIGNGTLDRLFEEEFGAVVARLKMKERRLFRIENRNLPPQQPFADKRLWYVLR
jgi:hypothetical protein